MNFDGRGVCLGDFVLFQCVPAILSRRLVFLLIIYAYVSSANREHGTVNGPPGGSLGGVQPNPSGVPAAILSLLLRISPRFNEPRILVIARPSAIQTYPMLHRRSPGTAIRRHVAWR